MSIETIAALVDRFIAETWGICEPGPYQAAMVRFFDKAISDAVAYERGRWQNELHNIVGIGDADPHDAAMTISRKMGAAYENGYVVAAED